MVLKIYDPSGRGVDLTQYIPSGGYKYSLIDTDKDSGRTLDGKMWREYICSKVKIEVELKEIPTSVCSTIFKALKNVYFYADFLDAAEGGILKSEFYNTTKPATCKVQKNGEEYWVGISLSLIER